MRGQADLFGEIHEDDEDEIVKIAWEAFEKRGYAIYEDFNAYMGQKMAQRRLKPTGGGWYHFIIKKVLEDAGWKRDVAHRPTRFYPPGTEPPENQHKKNQLNLFDKAEDS